MVIPHAAQLDAMPALAAKAEPIPGGVRLTVTSRTPDDASAVARLRGLGLRGILTLGAHHGRHHLAMARGEIEQRRGRRRPQALSRPSGSESPAGRARLSHAASRGARSNRRAGPSATCGDTGTACTRPGGPTPRAARLIAQPRQVVEPVARGEPAPSGLPAHGLEGEEELPDADVEDPVASGIDQREDGRGDGHAHPAEAREQLDPSPLAAGGEAPPATPSGCGSPSSGRSGHARGLFQRHIRRNSARENSPRDLTCPAGGSGPAWPDPRPARARGGAARRGHGMRAA